MSSESRHGFITEGGRPVLERETGPKAASTGAKNAPMNYSNLGFMDTSS